MSEQTITQVLPVPETLKTSMHAKVMEIASVLAERKADQEDIGLLTGKPGIAIFYFYLYRATGDEKYSELASQLLLDSFDLLNNGEKNHRFCAGIGGFLWSLEFLAEHNFLEREDVSEPLDQLDEFINRAMIIDMDACFYDYLHGALGNGLYFLKRLPHNPSVKIYLETLLDKLQVCSVKEADGSIKWESELNIETGSRGFNLSLSHGHASIIYFLSKALRSGISPAKSTELLEGCVRFMLKQQSDTKTYGSAFPSWIKDGEEASKSRLAWCYGDMGIGFALYEAALALKNKTLEERAVRILLDTCSRREVKEEYVLDAGICHGAAGMAYMYNRMFRNTGNQEFAASSRFWYEQTLEMANQADGLAGYKSWKTEKLGGWVPEFGMLEGVAGIGLCLIAGINDLDPAWDQCLCLS